MGRKLRNSESYRLARRCSNCIHRDEEEYAGKVGIFCTLWSSRGCKEKVCDAHRFERERDEIQTSKLEQLQGWYTPVWRKPPEDKPLLCEVDGLKYDYIVAEVSDGEIYQIDAESGMVTLLPEVQLIRWRKI